MAGNENSGRPEYQPTDDEREKVRVLRASGMTLEAVAEAIGISEPTLRKHFRSELDRATAKVRAEVTMARYRAAIGGNVSAQNKLLEQLGAVPDKPKQTKEPKPGKKEEADRAAQLPSPEWGEILQ